MGHEGSGAAYDQGEDPNSKPTTIGLRAEDKNMPHIIVESNDSRSSLTSKTSTLAEAMFLEKNKEMEKRRVSKLRERAEKLNESVKEVFTSPPFDYDLARGKATEVRFRAHSTRIGEFPMDVIAVQPVLRPPVKTTGGMGLMRLQLPEESDNEGSTSTAFLQAHMVPLRREVQRNPSLQAGHTPYSMGSWCQSGHGSIHERGIDQGRRLMQAIGASNFSETQDERRDPPLVEASFEGQWDDGEGDLTLSAHALGRSTRRTGGSNRVSTRSRSTSPTVVATPVPVTEGLMEVVGIGGEEGGASFSSSSSSSILNNPNNTNTNNLPPPPVFTYYQDTEEREPPGSLPREDQEYVNGFKRCTEILDEEGMWPRNETQLFRLWGLWPGGLVEPKPFLWSWCRNRFRKALGPRFPYGKGRETGDMASYCGYFIRNELGGEIDRQFRPLANSAHKHQMIDKLVEIAGLITTRQGMVMARQLLAIRDLENGLKERDVAFRGPIDDSMDVVPHHVPHWLLKLGWNLDTEKQIEVETIEQEDALKAVNRCNYIVMHAHQIWVPTWDSFTALLAPKGSHVIDGYVLEEIETRGHYGMSEGRIPEETQGGELSRYVLMMGVLHLRVALKYNRTNPLRPAMKKFQDKVSEIGNGMDWKEAQELVNAAFEETANHHKKDYYDERKVTNPGQLRWELEKNVTVAKEKGDEIAYYDAQVAELLNKVEIIKKLAEHTRSQQRAANRAIDRNTDPGEPKMSEGKLGESSVEIHLTPYSYLETGNDRTLPIVCKFCSTPYSILSDHINKERQCNRCGGNLLLCEKNSHSDVSSCLLQLSLSTLHTQDKLTLSQRVQLLGEYKDSKGEVRCLGCDIPTGDLWEEGRTHGWFEAESKKYLCLCQPHSILGEMKNRSQIGYSHTEEERKERVEKEISKREDERQVKESIGVSSNSSNYEWQNHIRLRKEGYSLADGEVAYRRCGGTGEMGSSNRQDLDKKEQVVNDRNFNFNHMNTVLSPAFASQDNSHNRSDDRDVSINRNNSHFSNSSTKIDPHHSRQTNYEPYNSMISHSFSTSHVENDKSLSRPMLQRHNIPQYYAEDSRPVSSFPVKNTDNKENVRCFGSGIGEQNDTEEKVENQYFSVGNQREGDSKKGTLRSTDNIGMMRRPPLQEIKYAPHQMENENYGQRWNNGTNGPGVGPHGRGWAQANGGYQEDLEESRNFTWTNQNREISEMEADSQPPKEECRENTDRVRVKIEGERYASSSQKGEGYRQKERTSMSREQRYDDSQARNNLALVPYEGQKESDNDSDHEHKSTHRKGRSRRSRKEYSDSEKDSTDEDVVLIENRNLKEVPNSLYDIFTRMECSPQYATSLSILRQLLKKSDFVEVKQGDRGQRRHVRFADYFPQVFTGVPRQLKRYLQRVLQYSALSTSDDQTRADVVADGLGLNATCTVELEQAARVPLPGFARDYEEDSASQKRRLLDVLLTFVVLFYQEEQTLALQDLRLKGPMFTGLTKLFHSINTGSTSLPAKLIEEYLTRAIARAENGEGVALLKAFQSQLRMMKHMDKSWTHDDSTHRLLLFNCCDTLATEDNSITLPPSASQPSVKVGGARRHEVHFASQQDNQQSRGDWGAYEGLMEEYTALAVTTQQPYERNDRRDRDEKAGKENSFSKRFCEAPCACCGTKDHPMLSPIRTPEGAPLNCEYVCPAALCNNWLEQRMQRNVNRFQPCPKKFAEMCKRDARRAHEAFVDYEKIGSGQYRRAQEKSKFRMEVLSHCDAPARGAMPQRTQAVGFTRDVRECNSARVEIRVGDMMNETVARSAGLPVIRSENERTIVTALQADGRTTTPQHISYSALHLILATNVEPASVKDIEAAKNGDVGSTTHREMEESVSTAEGGQGGRIRFRMPYGAEFVIPYPQICGRILADTGSTTTLINEEFARQQGLVINNTGPGLVLRDVNNGETTLMDHCYLRITLTTVLGERVTIVVLAHCAPNLSHDILLGTKDLEKYRISVVSHRGEAQIIVGDNVEILPMLDGTQISHLQYRLAKVAEEC